MVPRDIQPFLLTHAAQFPAIVLTGPRQSGKSTLCKAAFPLLAYVTLESPDIRAFAREDPRGFLAQFGQGAILDEIQNVPELASYLQEVIDRDPTPGKWVLTGSHNLALMKSTSQSLAGRASVLRLLPMSRSEVQRFQIHPQGLDQALLTGGYPPILDRQVRPSDWISAYVATYLERDVRTITQVGDLATFQRFIQLCAGRVGQLLNLSALASDCGVSQPTARSWLSVLEASFLVFRLPSYHGNVSKRLVKMPKLHFYDSGLVCWLLGIRTPQQLQNHPLRGAVFESWVVSEIIKNRFNHGDANGVYFYRDRAGHESDAVVDGRETRRLVEVKAGQTIAPNWAGNMAKIVSILNRGTNVAPVVVYGGADMQSRSGIQYLPWDAVQNCPWSS